MAIVYLPVIAVAAGIAGAGLGWLTSHLSKKLIAFKCKQRNRQEPDISVSGKAKWFSIILLALISMCAFTCGSLVIGGQFRYKAFFIVFFAMIAMSVSLTDIRLHLIPNECVLVLLVAGILYRVLFDGLSGVFNGLLGMGLAILVFGGTTAIFYFLKKTPGIGAGDLKWILATSFIAGYPGMLWFLGGTAVAILAYVYIEMKCHLLHMSDYFPMAAHLSFGFMVALLVPYVEAVPLFSSLSAMVR